MKAIALWAIGAMLAGSGGAAAAVPPPPGAGTGWTEPGSFQRVVTTPSPPRPRWEQLDNTPACEVWNTFPRPQESATWSGSCEAGRAHGEGALLWRYRRDGRELQERYQGQMVNGRKHGTGTYTWADGSMYEGEWANGQAHGFGTYTNPSGEVYTGHWSNGCFSQGTRWATVDATPAQCGFR